MAKFFYNYEIPSMKNKLSILFTFFLFVCTISCQSDTREFPPEKAILLFEKYIVGSFNNNNQIQEDLSTGIQKHPSSRLINARIDNWILNAPQREGFWLLEEGHFDNPGIKPEVKPYLFFYEALGDTAVMMHVYTFPNSIPSESIRHNNPDIKVEYSQLNASKNFKPMLLEYREEGFHIDRVFDLPGGMNFTFQKSIKKDRIELLELWYKDTKRMSTYDTALILEKE